MPFHNTFPHGHESMQPGMMHPAQWQQQQLQMMQGHMPQAAAHFNAWTHTGPQQAPGMMRTSPFGPPGMPAQPHLGGWPSAIPHQPTGPVWSSPDQQFAIQSFNGGPPQMFASHRPGGPMHHVTSPGAVPPQVRFQQLNYGRQFQFPQPGSSYLSPARPYTHALYPGLQPGLPSSWGYRPTVTINRPGMPSMPYGYADPRLPGGPRPPAASPSSRITINWNERAVGENSQRIAQALQQMSVAGQQISVQGVTGTFHLRHNIPPSRIDAHIAELQGMAARLTGAMQSMGWGGQMRVMSDGMRIWAENGSGQAVVATRTQLIMGRAPVQPGSGTWQGMGGEQIVWGMTPRGDEFRSATARVVELQDGRTLREVLQGGTVVASMFYEGRTDRPALVRVSGQGAAMPSGADGTGTPMQLAHGMHVIGDGGPVSVTNRPQTPEQARAMVQHVGQQLGSPEAIGAFVSSYFTVDDSVTAGGRRVASASTVNFLSEENGQQYIQSAEESLMRGTGDCEDFAVLAGALLTNAGVNNIVARVSPGHYACVYLERVPSGGFVVCKIDTGGFQRVPTVYPSAPQAMQSIWSGGGRSGVDWEVSTSAGMPAEAQARAREVAARGGGVSAILPETASGGNAHHVFLGFGEFPWEQLVYQRAGGPSMMPSGPSAYPRMPGGPPAYGGIPGAPSGMPMPGMPSYPGAPRPPQGLWDPMPPRGMGLPSWSGPMPRSPSSYGPYPGVPSGDPSGMPPSGGPPPFLF